MLSTKNLFLLVGILSGVVHASRLRSPSPLLTGSFERDGSQCSSFKVTGDCLDADGCSWCQMDGYAWCMLTSQARYMPADVAQCKDGQTPEANRHHTVTSTRDECRNVDFAGDCTARDACSWCEGMGGKSWCMSEMGAQFLPAGVAQCTSTSQISLKVPSVSIKVDSCTGLVDADACLAVANCSWCKLQGKSFLPSFCISTTKAHFVPPTVFQCNASTAKAISTASAVDGCGDVKDDAACVKNTKCSWCKRDSGIEWCMSKIGAHFLPADVAQCTSSGDDPTVDGYRVTPCKDLKADKDGCLGNANCSWCERFDGKTFCVSTQKAHFIPEVVAHCTASTAPQILKSNHVAKADSCKDHVDSDSCMTAEECSWCDGVNGKQWCMSRIGAHFLPIAVATCQGVDHVRTPPAVAITRKTDSCQGLKAQDTCLGLATCSWCRREDGKGWCMATKEAHFLPQDIVECKDSQRDPQVTNT